MAPIVLAAGLSLTTGAIVSGFTWTVVVAAVAAPTLRARVLASTALRPA